MNTNNLVSLEGDAGEWITAANQYFTQVGSMAATEIVASYQAADLLQTKENNSDWIRRTEMLKNAAKTRMHYLISCTEDRKDRIHLRRLFNAATNSSDFSSLFSWEF